MGTRQQGEGSCAGDHFDLYRAALKGDWKRAEAIFDQDESAFTAKLNPFGYNALQLAVELGHARFAVNTINRMPSEALKDRTNSGNTALNVAARSNCIDAARALVRKDPDLTQTRCNGNRAPILEAAINGSKDVLQFLSSATRDEDPSPLRGNNGAWVLYNAIANGLFDVAFELLQRYPELATTTLNGKTALDILSQRPSAFPSGTHLNTWEHLLYSCIGLNQGDGKTDQQQCGKADAEDPCRVPIGYATVQIPSLNPSPMGCRIIKDSLWRLATCVPGVQKLYEIKLMHDQSTKLMKFIVEKISTSASSSSFYFFPKEDRSLRRASENGTVEIVVECIQQFPQLLWLANDNRSIFHTAIENRQETIFNLIYSLNSEKKLLLGPNVEKHNNILHLAAKLAPSSQLNSISGAGLQMQRELQWLKVVEEIVEPSYRLHTNDDGKTPQALFSEEHKNLLDKGEKWMKDTASSCMIVATLITTVAFAAAFTVPGGNQDSGMPIFLKDTVFVVFLISDAVALFSSTISVLMFMSILTARYAEEDFLKVLPTKLIIGLASLFISNVAVVIAFSTTLRITSGHQYSWLMPLIVFLACFPIALFVVLQFPLLVRVMLSTYGSGIFTRKSKYALY